MPQTRDFHDTVAARAKRDPAFQNALLAEALQSFIEGEVAPGLIILRDCINATVGFGALSKQTRIPEKSLMRMVGPRGNPTASNLFAMVAALRAPDAPPLVVDWAQARLTLPSGKEIVQRGHIYAPGEKIAAAYQKAAKKTGAKRSATKAAAKPAAPAKRRA